MALHREAGRLYSLSAGRALAVSTCLFAGIAWVDFITTAEISVAGRPVGAFVASCAIR